MSAFEGDSVTVWHRSTTNLLMILLNTVFEVDYITTLILTIYRCFSRPFGSLITSCNHNPENKIKARESRRSWSAKELLLRLYPLCSYAIPCHFCTTMNTRLLTGFFQIFGILIALSLARQINDERLRWLWFFSAARVTNSDVIIWWNYASVFTWVL